MQDRSIRDRDDPGLPHRDHGRDRSRVLVHLDRFRCRNE
jgi:hypothetical protein